MTEPEGHLFVVHGRIESVIRDAVVIAKGSEWGASRSWTPLVGEDPPPPTGWIEQGFGRITSAPEPV